MPASIRPYRADDEIETASVWHRAGLVEYTYLPTWQAFTLTEAERVFAEVVVPDADVWVAERDDRVVGYLALRERYVDRLYVDPPHQGAGIGAGLLAHAMSLHPAGLTLHTHQQNHRARAFYERYGFKVLRFGTSPPPESAPDVEYAWGGGS